MVAHSEPWTVEMMDDPPAETTAASMDVPMAETKGDSSADSRDSPTERTKAANLAYWREPWTEQLTVETMVCPTESKPVAATAVPLEDCSVAKTVARMAVTWVVQKVDWMAV